MSKLHKVLKKCALCGKEHYFVEAESAIASGYMDLDTRPPRMKRDQLKYGFHEASMKLMFWRRSDYSYNNINIVV